MLPDRVSNPGPLTYESGALPIALRGPAERSLIIYFNSKTAGPADEECITSQMSSDESYYICGR